MLPVQHLEVRSVEQMAAQPPLEFFQLKEDYPEAFAKAFGDVPMEAAFADALRTGHKTYVGEACWHCHSQQIRPWGNDEARYGRKSFPEEYHNELNMPPLWGTRRIGPDLIRRGGKQSNDWHVAHFYNPPDVNPESVMPSYPWFYEADGLTPNRTGLSVIAYVQWLGSWVPTVGETVYDVPFIEETYAPAVLDRPAKPAEAGTMDEGESSTEEGGGDFWE
ncbi:MAG: cbb3-type cytochrome c oxidase subunit II [Acidobacteria bacterium]|nr:cbb3-type cytochrome c oxidase subunit II [Acidobacteriota bacterium]